MHAPNIRLVETSRLLPTEEHYPDRAERLVRDIASCGVWTTPILVLDQHYIVLDGHHRLQASRTLRLDRIPCLLVAAGSPDLSLSCWRVVASSYPDE
ncbi:ParB N-terminal domain-containing protein [Thioclava sp. GXIMD4215]|uniref:ParB N-terminal domain-containing protein n=1 Tax=Thioclava sp. GXIMD4215 TaxID=3131928 RepID=UPI003873568B